jgi:hypothetical protein
VPFPESRRIHSARSASDVDVERVVKSLGHLDVVTIVSMLERLQVMFAD